MLGIAVSVTVRRSLTSHHFRISSPTLGRVKDPWPFPFPTPPLAALKTALAPKSHPLSPAPKQFYAVARAALLRSTPRGRACCRWPWATAQIQLRIIPPGLRCLHTRIYCGSMSLHRVLAEQARAVLGDRCAKGPRTPARAPPRVRLCRASTLRNRELPTAARRRLTPL